MSATIPPPKRRLARLSVTVAAFAMATAAHAGLQIPYVPDASTLHLWHLDEPSGLTAADAVAGGITLTNLGMPNPGTGPYTNTSFGGPAFAGQGTCVSATTKQHLLYGGAFPDVSQFVNPVSGAFTFEALVKFNLNPLGSIDAEIVTGDNGLGLANRGWQWRIFNGVMEWDLLAGSTDNDFKAPLPATGANAAITGAWYHAAVTFTGYSPTNGDTPNLITFYWTLLDPNRTAASQLAQFTATRPLDGSPSGASQPSLGLGGSARNTTSNPGNGEGLIGSIDEVRISSVARGSNQMAFVTGGAQNPPSFTQQPPTNTLVGYGQTLTVPALVSGSLPLSYQWQQDGTNLAGQNDTTLVVPRATFAQGGSYQLVVTNAYGSATSSVAQVTIGAAATELFNTGLDPNGVVSAGDIPDPHWTLFQSADVSYLGPDTLIFENSNPLQFASPNGAFSPTNGISMWMGLAGNAGGSPVNSPAGQYLYRATFLLDSAEPDTVAVQGNLWVNGSISDILVNGKSTGIALAPGGTLYVTTFAITNGFVPGVNTLDFVEDLTAAGISALRVEIHGVGLALPPGPPAITTQPAHQTVRDGSIPPTSQASFSVVALGRPPLSYQWWADGAPVPGATNRTLTFVNPTTGAQGTNFSVVVSNDSGSVTSRLAALTLVSSNQPPVPAAFSFVAFQGQAVTLPLSRLVQSSTDPDHDPISFVTADNASTNALPYGSNNVNQVGAALVYSPAAGYLGADQFSYTISDQAATAQGFVDILVLAAPTSQVIAPGGTANFGVGVSSPPPGYSFQWQLNGTNVTGGTGGQVTITNAAVADAGTYTVIVTDPLGQTWLSPVAGLTVGTLGTGTGLTGDYYSNMTNGLANFVGLPTLTRVDPTVNFNWGAAAPDPSLSANYFLVRWHGQVQPLYSDVYTFSTTSDDGSRLWVNGQLLVNQWQNQAATTGSGTIALQANQKYDLVMEYYQWTSADVAQLSWSSLHQAPQIIPMSQLYPGAGLLRPAVMAGLRNGTNLVVNWAGTFSLESATNISVPWSVVATNTVSPSVLNVGIAPQKFFRLVNPISP